MGGARKDEDKTISMPNSKNIDHFAPSAGEAVEDLAVALAAPRAPTAAWTVVRPKGKKVDKAGKGRKQSAGTSSTYSRTSEVANVPGGKKARQRLNRKLRQKGEQQTAPDTGASVPNAPGPSSYYKDRQKSKLTKTNESEPEPHAPPAIPTSLLAAAAESDSGRGRGMKTKANNRLNRRKRAALAVGRSAQAPTASPAAASAAVRVEPGKRTRLDDTVSPRGEHKKQRLDSQRRTPTVSYAQMAQNNSLCVAVVRSGNEQMTEEQAKLVKRYLQSRILDDVKNPELSFSPRFQGKPIVDEGALKLWCEDVPSLEWLTDAIKQLPTASCPNLAVVKQSDLTKKVRAAIFIPDCTFSLDDTSLLLADQNKWAQVNQWTVYSHQMQADDILFVSIGIPETLIPVLMEKGRRLAYGLGSVYVRFYGVEGKLQDDPPQKRPRKTLPQEPGPKSGSGGTAPKASPDKPASLPPLHSSPKPSCSKAMEEMCERSAELMLSSDTADEADEGTPDDGVPNPFSL